MTEHSMPKPPTAPYINDQRCIPLIRKLFGTDGTHREMTRAIAVSHGSQFHLPKLGNATIDVTVVRGDIHTATIDLGQHRLRILSFSAGLDGTCLAVRVQPESGDIDTKIFLDIPLAGLGSTDHVARLLEALFQHAGDPGYVVEPIESWLNQLSDRAEHLSK